MHQKVATVVLHREKPQVPCFRLQYRASSNAYAQRVVRPLSLPRTPGSNKRPGTKQHNPACATTLNNLPTTGSMTAMLCGNVPKAFHSTEYALQKRWERTGAGLRHCQQRPAAASRQHLEHPLQGCRITMRFTMLRVEACAQCLNCSSTVSCTGVSSCSRAIASGSVSCRSPNLPRVAELKQRYNDT